MKPEAGKEGENQLVQPFLKPLGRVGPEMFRDWCEVTQGSVPTSRDWVLDRAQERQTLGKLHPSPQLWVLPRGCHNPLPAQACSLRPWSVLKDALELAGSGGEELYCALSLLFTMPYFLMSYVNVC